MRIDQLLVSKGLARSRSQAKELITKGMVRVLGVPVTKASQDFDESSEITVEEADFAKYVSRAGLKMEKALDYLDIDVKGLSVLDIGLSTGGFSDCLIKKGVKKIIGVDVGHDQLAEVMKKENTLISFEGINARKLSEYRELTEHLGTVDFVVMDISFISILKVLPEIAKVFSGKTLKLLSLVKPQFELQKKSLNKLGVVKNEEDYGLVRDNVLTCLEENSFNVLAYFASGIVGADGNKEFFVYASLDS